ncbi:uncharacterized protein N7483_001252 [Penicillium malachiteum]|uniref:uncharacterized protein n=1 Tax=Penicillium malachiteum TaxID=1324776 RepID=UPI00254732FA|nr:uncharacterized protein N7483_001252 [Penicillium malachiteum]KAJ5736127.1 hypothetical protein N7483_001252 [Penicillium malachiteum]
MTDNYDLEMRLAIVGRELEDVVDAEAQHETPVAEPHDSSAPTVSGSIFPQLDGKLRVHDTRALYPVSYVRSRVVGSVPRISDNPVIQPPMASSALLETEIENVLSFVPAHIFAKFPQKYISNASQQDYIIEHFFKDIWNRSWDLFYLPLPERQAHQSLILVPQSQAENMLSHINAVVSLKLTLDGMKQDRLVLDFVNLPIPKPLYLGRSNDAEEKKFLQGNIQRMENFAEWDDLAKDNNSLIFRAFTQYLKNVILPTMNCKKARWNSKRRAKMAKMAKWTSQLNWLLSCLGLRPPPASESSPNGDQQSVLAPVNVLMAPEWDFHNNPVFVSIDCEWMERSSWALTEVGISILDTHDLVNLPPGDYGENWKKRIRSYHLRVSEHESHINQEFCLGCPDKFEWGQSYLIDHDHMGVTIDHYLSSHGAGRNLILVGLAMDHDLQILRRTGSVYFSQPEGAMFNDRLDVAYLFRALRNIDVHHGMARLLGELNELHSEWLHNAGNDARYTMHALVRIAMEAAGEKQESEMEVVD